MIKKLHLKFVLINMSIFMIMLCVILSLIYQLTKKNFETNSIAMMRSIAMRPFHDKIPNELEKNIRLPYFTIQINKQGEINTTGGGYYDLSDEEFLQELIDKTNSKEKNWGIIEEYNLRYYRTETPKNSCLVFVDISSELTALHNLIKTSAFILLLSFFPFLAISLFLARWAIKPVKTAWEQQRQFVADASHELKTPLTVIMTNAELLQNPEYTKENYNKFSKNILTMSRKMRRLIEQMLELARTDASQEHVVYSSLSFSKLVSNTILPFEPIFYEKGLSLTTDIEENIQVKGAEDKLCQVIEILLDNARKYSRNSGQTQISLQKQGSSHCVLTVANEGDAIPPEDLKKLFKRFYRTDKARSQSESFGLGLSIAENIITKHYGKIWAESKKGINRFYVKLPCL